MVVVGLIYFFYCLSASRHCLVAALQLLLQLEAHSQIETLESFVAGGTVRHFLGVVCLPKYVFIKKLKNVSCEYDRLNG